MSDPTTLPTEPAPEMRPFSLWRRICWISSIFLLVLLVIGGALFTYEQSRAERRSRSSLAELDKDDPGWRQEEIEAARVSVPDALNSGRLCKELARLLGPRWPDPKFDESFQQLALPQRLDEERMKILEAEMKRLAPLRLAARPLADMPRGRHEITYAFNPVETLLTDTQETRKVASLFRYEMIYLANKGDVTSAIRSARACVCAGRALYDEPFIISQLVRIAIIAVGLDGAERSLSLGEAKEEELIALQKLLADEEKHPTLLVSMRGERALMYQLFSRVASGELPTDISLDMGTGQGSWLERMVVYPRWQFRRQQPIIMDLMNRSVENARLPAWEQAAAEKKLEDDARAIGRTALLVGKLMPSLHKAAQAYRRKTALVACMRTLIGVERYRMKHGTWPTKLGEVVPDFLDHVPRDPFDGKPLRMVRVADGVIVYSVGLDGIDDGGKLNRERPTDPGTDLGYQLWDLPRRRQPASPRPKEAEEKQP